MGKKIKEAPIKEPIKEAENNEIKSKEAPKKLAIGEDEIAKATKTLLSYQKSKSSLEERIKENEKFWQLKQWEVMNTNGVDKQIKPASAWTFNCVTAKHADAMDSFPEPIFIPREKNDEKEAKMLSSVVPVILEQNKYRKEYSNTWWYKLKNGVSCKGIFWDATKLNGLGDITIKKIDLLNLFWEPGITNLQDSKNVFHTELIDNDTLDEMYPELKGKEKSSALKSEYAYGESVDNTNKSCVVDWYYHKMVNGKNTLQYVKYVGSNVLYATENDTETTDNDVPMNERGLYDHCKYPFVIDVLFPTEGSITGLGYIDICKGPQQIIDMTDQGIIENILQNSKPRWLVQNDSSVNEKEFTDLSKPFVHVPGGIQDVNLKQITVTPLSGICETVRINKIDEMKETSGNRDASNGQVSAGVTAASAIAALQEAGGKLSRDMITAEYEIFKEECTFIQELIRQFYDVPRQLRITGEDGEPEYIDYDNSGMVPQEQEVEGQEVGYRVPVFDIQIIAQKENPYTRMSQNDLAIQLMQLGVFRPDMADQSLMMLDMMDFKGKDKVYSKVKENGNLMQQMLGMQQQMAQMAQIIDKLTGGQTNTLGALTESTAVDAGEDSGNGGNVAKVSTQNNSPEGIVETAKARTRNTFTPR